MRRRTFLGSTAAAPLFAQSAPPTRPLGAQAFERLGSKLRITAVKVFGVSLNAQSGRPYVFVKLETNQGLTGWGEATLEGKAAATIACVEDFKDFLIGADPLQVEHHWQSMYVHSFYRAGPVMGSAISGLGFDLSEDALKRYPFKGTRPMARVFHPDGSVAAW
jgi:hypothetical protein